MAISLAGSLTNGGTGSSGVTSCTGTYTIVGTGNLVVVMTDYGTTNTMSSVSDSNSRVTWQGSAVVNFTSTGLGQGAGIWYGVSTSTGSTTVTINFGGSVNGPECNILELHESTAGQSWSVVTSAGHDQTGNGTVTWPNLTSASSGDQAYVGQAACSGSPTGGSTSGFTYVGGTLNGNILLYNLSLSTSTAYAPTSSDSLSETEVAAIFKSAPSGAAYYPFTQQSMVARNRAAIW